MDSITITFQVTPIGKPRMTQRDKWAKRLPVVQYYAFKDQMQIQINQAAGLLDFFDGGNVTGLSWVAFLPMPESWSKRKKAEMAGQLHRAKPDRDNIDKAILDSLFANDSGIATGHIEKRWDDGKGPRIEITFTKEKSSS